MLLMLLVTSALHSTAQTVFEKDANGIMVQQQTIHTQQQALGNGIATGEQFKDLQGNLYPVYKSAKGRLFIVRKAKSGNHYKVYLDEKQPDKADK